MCPIILEFLCHFSGSLRLSSISDPPFPRSCVFPVLFGFCLGEDHSCVDGKYTFENMYDWKCIILSSHLINCLTWYRILVVGSATLVVNNFSHDVKDIFLFLVIIEKCDLILIPSPGITYFFSLEVWRVHTSLTML